MPALHGHPSITRRTLLTGAGAAATLLATGGFGWAAPAEVAGSDLFTLGVASGDPLPDGVVLWTRLAPDPLAGGGMPDAPVEVAWEVATDETFERVVQRGTELARPELGHTVHVEVEGLEPAAWYWYRFRSGASISRVGRTRTAPAPGSSPERLRFAFAACQNYPAGFYAAYRHMAADDLDLVVHLGDYIYESGNGKTRMRPHEGRGEPKTLVEYRNRYAQYKTDPHLQAAHAAFPFVVTWDDHEVDGNWAAGVPIDPEKQSAGRFQRRRAAATAAYWENMPLRFTARPRGTSMQLYRRLDFGDLAGFHVLDGRQYRTNQPCETPEMEGARAPDCLARFDPAATMLGGRQERWLRDGLLASRARWNVLANQTVFAQFDFDTSLGRVFSTDAWDGYPLMRRRLLELMGSGAVSNPVVLTGDCHSSRVNELRLDFDLPGSPIVGTEFAGAPITSAAAEPQEVIAALPANPHVRYFDGLRRGYTRCELTRDQWRTDFRLLPASTVEKVTVPSADLEIEQAVSWVVPDGGTVQPG